MGSARQEVLAVAVLKLWLSYRRTLTLNCRTHCWLWWTGWLPTVQA